jgi:hypothetical protein
MAEERFPEQQEKDRTGGQHGTRNVDDPDAVQPKKNDTPSDKSRWNETGIEDGGARHRTQ